MARNYKAEYARRQAKSQREYGVSYGKQRGLVEKGRDLDLDPDTVRKSLSRSKDSPPSNLDSLIATALNYGDFDMPDDFDVAAFWATYTKR